MHYTWPIVRRMEAPGHVPSNLFDMSDDISSRAMGLPGFLILAFDANAENPLSKRSSREVSAGLLMTWLWRR